MRKVVAAMAMSVMLLVASPSFAGVNNLVDGVNGIATAPLTWLPIVLVAL